VMDGVRDEAEEYRELADQRVLVLDRLRGRGKRSGIEVDDPSTRGARLFAIADGKVRKIVKYVDRDRALADLGLTPEDA